MKAQFKSLIDFLAFFKDEETCLKHFEQMRFRCSKCREDFTIKTKTIFGESKLPLRTRAA